MDLGDVSDILMLQEILYSPDLRAGRKLGVNGRPKTYGASENVRGKREWQLRSHRYLREG